jgi:galactose mutarotase-like enzyme
MIKTIKNDYLEVSASTLGAELTSVKDVKTNQELLWQASEVWPHHDVVLFPFIGPNKEYEINGQLYNFSGNHGFMRTSEVKLIDYGTDFMSFELKDNEETFKAYPYHFTLKITYRLAKNALRRSYEVTSNDKSPLPFCLGDHAAYQVKFGTAILKLGDTPLTFIERPNGVFKDKVSELPFKGNHLLDKEDFKKYETILLVNPHHPLSLDTGLGMRLTYHFRSPYIAIWSPSKEADFLCVEPWWGISTYEKMPKKFIDRNGVNFAYPSQVYEELISFNETK